MSKMLTPCKNPTSRRLHTTAATEHYLSTNTITELTRDREDLLFVYPELNPIRKALFIDHLQEKQTTSRTYEASIVQKKYRRQMTQYLDEKFEGKGKGERQ